jgi:hypothetical protein
MMQVPHKIHIPVMGLGFTVDSPIKVAKFGISSVVSIMDDHLLEDMRRLYSRKLSIPYQYIDEKAVDYRAERITTYLNLLHEVVQKQVEDLKEEDFGNEGDIDRYFELLPFSHPLRKSYQEMLDSKGEERTELQNVLRKTIVPGKIDVNIMTKVDKVNFDKDGNELPREYSDALSALRGFARSNVDGSVVFSAGMNPALFSYAEQFADFFPDKNGKIKKGIILKVSDYRSALIQGRFLAKKDYGFQSSGLNPA